MVPKKTVCIAKRSFMYVPFLGLFWWMANQIFIDRSSRVDAINTLDAARKRIMEQQHSVWIFPEGTRNDKGLQLLPFKKGAFHLAVQAGVPIIPTIFSPITSIIDTKKMLWKGGVYRVVTLPPIYPKNKTVDQLLNEVQIQMQNTLDNLAEEAKKYKQL